MADVVPADGFTQGLPNTQEPSVAAGESLEAPRLPILTDEWWKQKLEKPKHKFLAVAAAMTAVGATVIPSVLEEIEQRKPPEITQSADGEANASFDTLEELYASLGSVFPEQLGEASLEAEELIYQTIRNNNPGPGESPTLEEQNSWMWRGAVLMEVGVPTTDGKQANAWLRLDNPYEVTIGNSVYWVASQPNTGQLLTVEFGSRATEGGGISVNERYLLSEPRPYNHDTFSGQRVSAKPLSYDREGLRILDNYEQLLRDNKVELLPRAEFYLSKEEASVGLGEPLYVGTDPEAVNRDHNALKG